jgi:hypothetical protein
MAANERTNITSFSTVTSVQIMQNDFTPRGFYPGGLTLSFNANSNWLGTIGADNGVGIVDVTSFVTGAASIGGAAGQKLFQKTGFFPWKVWINITSCAGNVNVSASL